MYPYPPAGPQPYAPGPPVGYAPGPPVINRQPMMGVPMQLNPMMPVPAVPIGLENLMMVDCIIVKQLVEFLEVLISYEGKNKYVLLNAMGGKVFYAVEQSGHFERQCSGEDREFTMQVVDNLGREIIRVHRPHSTCNGSCGCFHSCRTECTVENPPGYVIGLVVQTYAHGRKGSFNVFDERSQLVFTIEKHFNEFEIKSPATNAVVASIHKKWSGLAEEIFTDADTFEVTFPIDLDVKMKAVLVGATFLMDFMFYEKSNNK